MCLVEGNIPEFRSSNHKAVSKETTPQQQHAIRITKRKNRSSENNIQKSKLEPIPYPAEQVLPTKQDPTCHDPNNFFIAEDESTEESISKTDNFLVIILTLLRLTIQRITTSIVCTPRKTTPIQKEGHQFVQNMTQI